MDEIIWDVTLFFSVERYGSLYISDMFFFISWCLLFSTSLSHSNVFCKLVAHLVELVCIHSYCYSPDLLIDFSMSSYENDSWVSKNGILLRKYIL